MFAYPGAGVLVLLRTHYGIHTSQVIRVSLSPYGRGKGPAPKAWEG